MKRKLRKKQTGGFELPEEKVETQSPLAFHTRKALRKGLGLLGGQDFSKWMKAKMNDKAYYLNRAYDLEKKGTDRALKRARRLREKANAIEDVSESLLHEEGMLSYDPGDWNIEEKMKKGKGEKKGKKISKRDETLDVTPDAFLEPAVETLDNE